MKQNTLIVWLEEVKKEDKILVGEKAAQLGELNSLKINIPQGFIVTTTAYHYFIEKNSFEKEIRRSMSMFDLRYPESLKAISDKIKNLLLSGSIPFDFAKEIIDCYFRLESPLQDSLVALRSSINSPLPLPNQTTLLNVKGEANVIEALKQCWASLFSPENILSLQNKNQDILRCSPTVLVQKMVQSQTSGIIYTQDFLKGEKNVILIEAIYGLGELATKGEIRPDRYLINKQTLEILEKRINKQEFELKQKGSLNKKVKIPKSHQKKQKIKDETIIELAKTGKKIQDYYFFAQKIEWAIEKKKIFILQTKRNENKIH